MNKRLPKKEYEYKKHIKSQEKHMSDKTRKTRAVINGLFKKWHKEDIEHFKQEHSDE